jgi:hypothetical protein
MAKPKRSFGKSRKHGALAMAPKKLLATAKFVHVQAVREVNNNGKKHFETNKSTYFVGRNAMKRATRKPYGMPKKVWNANVSRRAA